MSIKKKKYLASFIIGFYMIWRLEIPHIGNISKNHNHLVMTKAVNIEKVLLTCFGNIAKLFRGWELNGWASKNFQFHSVPLTHTKKYDSLVTQRLYYYRIIMKLLLRLWNRKSAFFSISFSFFVRLSLGMLLSKSDISWPLRVAAILQLYIV